MPPQLEAAGSLWRRWDPHTHLPGTLFNDQYDGSSTVADALEVLASRRPSIEVVGVTDYCTTASFREAYTAWRGGAGSGIHLLWLAATILLFFFLTSALEPIAKKPGDGDLIVSIFAAALTAYAIAMWFLLPRMRTKDGQPARSNDATAALQWLMASAPFMMGFAAVAAGGEQWVLGVGFVSSVVLLVVSARRTARR